MPSRDDSRDMALSIEEEFKKIYSSVSFTMFKGKVCDYDSSMPETAYLSPDQDAVNMFFLRTGGLLRPEVRNALEAFFSSTVKACKLYRVLLKGIHKARQSQSSLNQALFEHIPRDSVLDELNKFAASENPFSHETLEQFQHLQATSEQLERELGGMKQMLDTKQRKEKTLNKVLPYVLLVAGSPVLLCLALPAALVSNVADTLRGWWVTVRERFSSGSELQAQCAQLDAADKGNYIIIHDLMTIKRLVTRLRNDVENSKRRIVFFREAMQDHGSLRVIVHQLRINTSNSDQQMKDFSEQVMLCCRTIEKARKLVFEKITGEPWDTPVQIFTEDGSSSNEDIERGLV